MNGRQIIAMAGGLGLLAGSAAAQCEWTCDGEKGEARTAGVTTVAFSGDHHNKQPSTDMGSKKDIVDTAVAAGQFNTLAAALKAAGLVETLKGEGPFTVFAPTDAAFEKLPKGTVEMLLKPENKKALTQILTYHVVPGNAMAKDVLKKDHWQTVNGQRIDISMRDEKAYVDGAQIVKTDVGASNGVIHVIDTVIMPESKNIVQVADTAGSFSTLLSAAKAAGLVETLTGEGPYTVFAPTDEAFAKLGQSTINDLLKEENRDRLKSILLYHVVPGRVYSDQAEKAGRAETAQGGTVRFSDSYGAFKVNDAGIVNADIEASNGVIHVIDSVLMPR